MSPHCSVTQYQKEKEKGKTIIEHLTEYLPMSCAPHPMPLPYDLPYSKLGPDHLHLQLKCIFHPH